MAENLKQLEWKNSKTQYMFWLRNKKINFWYTLLIEDLISFRNREYAGEKNVALKKRGMAQCHAKTS